MWSDISTILEDSVNNANTAFIPDPSEHLYSSPPKIESPSESFPYHIPHSTSLASSPGQESDPECVKVGIPSSSVPPHQESPKPPSVRRGPGRPPKPLNSTDRLHSTDSNYRSIRRQYHNESATRSRAKFNSLLDELWNEIPEDEKLRVIGTNASATRIVSRSEKIQAALSYVQKLTTAVKMHCRP